MNLLDDQCEFADIGMRLMRYVAGRLGKARFVAFDESMNNGRVVKAGLHR